MSADQTPSAVTLTAAEWTELAKIADGDAKYRRERGYLRMATDRENYAHACRTMAFLASDAAVEVAAKVNASWHQCSDHAENPCSKCWAAARESTNALLRGAGDTREAGR